MRSKVLTILLACAAGTAQAGGLWIQEYGDPAMGRASAGADAGTDDAVTSLRAPAAMSRIDTAQIMVTGGIIASDVKFDVDQGSLLNGNGNGGSAGSIGPGAGLFYVRPLSERWTLGMSISGWTGAVLDYDRDWAGRFQATDVDLLVMGGMPAVAYEVNDWLSLGLGIPVLATNLKLKINVPNPTDPIGGEEGGAKLDGDDVQVGVNLSALITFSERTRVGLTYNSKFEFEYDTDISLQPAGFEAGIDTKLNMAELARISLVQQLTEDLTGYLTFGWENWSDMDNIILSGENRTATLPRNWKDTYKYSAGIDYVIDPAWTLRAGMAYDTNPVDQKDRTADMPIDRQVRYALGLSHTRDRGPNLSAQLVYADYGSADISRQDNLPVIGFDGDYKNNDLVFFSVSAQWQLRKRR